MILPSYEKTRTRNGERCDQCHSDTFQTIVAKAIKITQACFDGLCLDCLDPKTPKHAGDLQSWEIGKWCRVKKHGEPTRYYSTLVKEHLNVDAKRVFVRELVMAKREDGSEIRYDSNSNTFGIVDDDG